MAAGAGAGEHVAVLVVDDDEIVRTWLEYALGGSEFYVMEGVEGADGALEVIGRSHPGLLLVDYRLPGSDGIELIRRLREQGVEAPAVLMSAATQRGLNEEALEAGYDGVYVKSGRREALLEVLRLVVAGEPAFDHRNPQSSQPDPRLDETEREVIDLITRGYTTQELAERSGISVEEARAAFEHATEKIQRRHRSTPIRRDAVAAAPTEPEHERDGRSPAPTLAYAERAAVLAAFLRSVDDLMRSVRRDVAGLEAAGARGGSGASLATAAHVLKGGAATAGLQDVAALAAQLEATALSAEHLAPEEVRRLVVLLRELDVRVDRLPAPDAVGLSGEVTPPPADGRTATIVYIDDDPASLKLVDVLLAREPGFRLVTAHSGHDGVRAVSVEHPALVFLDLRLPDLDGLEVLDRIRGLEGGIELPVVLLTGEAGNRLAELQRAADLVLTKPLDLGRFFEVVGVLRDELDRA